MIKGLVALFTSGIIFNPMVLFGVISGAYTIVNKTPEEIRALFLTPFFYAVIAGISVGYTIIFARVYKIGGVHIDWFATSGSTIWNFIRYFIAFVLSMSFVIMISIF